MLWTVSTPEGRPGDFSDVSPLCEISWLAVWSQCYISPLLFCLQSCRNFCFIIVCFRTILLIFFSINLHFLKGRFFSVSLVLCWSSYDMSILGGGMCSACYDIALVSAIMHCCIFFPYNLHIHFNYVIHISINLNLLVLLKRQTETVHGSSII